MIIAITFYTLHCVKAYFVLINFSFAVSIFIADDFTLNGKSTYLLSVVKSSKIITGKSVLYHWFHLYNQL